MLVHALLRLAVVTLIVWGHQWFLQVLSRVFEQYCQVFNTDRTNYNVVLKKGGGVEN